MLNGIDLEDVERLESRSSATYSGPPSGSTGVIVNHYIDPPETPAEFTFTNLVVQAVQ